MRGGRSEHHALDVHVGGVERRQLPRTGVPPPSMTTCGRAMREAGHVAVHDSRSVLAKGPPEEM